MNPIPCRVFGLCAPPDDAVFEALAVLLRPHRAAIDVTYSGEFAVGEALQVDRARLHDADLVLLLISPLLLDPQNQRWLHALACVKQLLAAGRLHVIPVPLRSTMLPLPEFQWLDALHRLPIHVSWRDGVSGWSKPNREQAWVSLADAVLKYAQDLGWRRPKHNLPPNQNPDSVARLDLRERLHELLSGHSPEGLGGPVCISQPQRALVGLGGVGKTYLAIMYALHYAGYYRSLLWVEAAGSELTMQFAQLYTVLQLPASALPRIEDPEYSKIAATNVRETLESGGPHLLILDNVDHPTAYKAWLPRFGRTRVLITTRRSDLEVSDYNTLKVDVLSEQEAFDLLMGLTEPLDGQTGGPLRQPLELPSQQEEEAARELCRALGYLALPLHVVSRLLHKRARLPSMILAEVRKHGTLEALKSEYFRHNPNMYNLFDSSYEALESEDVKQLAKVAGFFAPIGIPTDLLYAAKNQLRREARIGENASALERLLDYGLVQRSLNGRVSVHLLMQEFLRRKSGGGGADQQAVLNALALQLRGPQAQVNPPDLEELASLEYLQMHLTYAYEQIRQRVNEKVYDSLSLHLYIPLRLAQYFSRRAEYDAALRICQQIFAFGNIVPLKWRAAFHHYEGWFLLRMGRYKEALASYQKVLKLSRSEASGRCGLSAELLCHTYHDLGQIWSKLGEYHRAQRWFTRSYKIRRKTQKTNPRAALMSRHWIGQTYADLGDYKQAERVLSVVLKAKRRHLKNPNDPSIGNTLQALGEVLFKLGKLELAHACLDEASQIYEYRSSARNPEIISTYVVRAEVFRHQGLYEQAEKALLLAKQLQEEVRKQHPDLAVILRSIGSLHLSRFAASHPDGSLSVAYDRLREAQAHTLASDGYGEKHPQAIQILCKLGEVQAALKSVKESLDSLKRAHELMSQVLDTEHPETAACAYALGRFLCEQGSDLEAHSYLVSALVVFEKSLGSHHPRTRAVRTLLKLP